VKRLIVLQGMLFIVFVLLGNGLRSVATMTVSVSEGEFASFLNISIDRTDLLVELLVGGAVMALAVAPFLINPRTARRVATIAALASAVCYATIGITMRINPQLLTREIIVISCFAQGGFWVAFLAPLAQLSISTVTDQKQRTHLTTVWTSAQPIGFLLAPQLVKYVSFDIGTGNYFLILAAMPLVFLAIVPMVVGRPAAASTPAPETPVPWSLVGGFLVAVLAFEAWTTSNTFAGIGSIASLSLMVLFLVVAAIVAVRGKAALAGARQLPSSAIWLLVILFVLEIPTTGLYDTAYLTRHLCSADLISDRATLGAACQIFAVFMAGGLLARRPHLEKPLLGLAVIAVFTASVAVAFYPFQSPDAWLFYASKVVGSLGMGTATSIIVAHAAGVSHGNKIIMLAPAFIVMFGTEVGIELLEIIFQMAKLAGSDELGAYQTIFFAQILAALLAGGLMAERAIYLLSQSRKANRTISAG
jgi:hypothetical protein